jgi:hypothetical protein
MALRADSTGLWGCVGVTVSESTAIAVTHADYPQGTATGEQRSILRTSTGSVIKTMIFI